MQISHVTFLQLKAKCTKLNDILFSNCLKNAQTVLISAHEELHLPYKCNKNRKGNFETKNIKEK